MKFILAASILFMCFISFNNSAIIRGCMQNITDSYGQVKCIKCFFGMGLTSNFTCQFCKLGYSVVGGTCQLNSVNPVVNATDSSTIAVKNFQTSNKKPSTVQQKTQQNISTQSFTSNIPDVFDTSSGFSDQNAQYFQFTSASQTNTINPSTLKTTTTKTQQIYKIPENCLSYSFIAKICSKCSDKYQPNQKGVCSKIQQKDNNQNKKKTNTQISSRQSYDPTQSILPDKNLITTQTNHNIQKQLYNLLQDKVDTSKNTPISQNQQSSSNDNKNSQTPKIKSQNNFAPNLINFLFQNKEKKQQTAKQQISANIQPIVHKFPAFPFCDDYADNQCFACVPGYILNLIVNKCIAYIKPPPVKLADSQADNQISKEPSAPKPETNCDLFSSQQGVCKQCYRNYFLNKNTKLCQLVDTLCRTYNPDTGICLSCYRNFTVSQEGKCINN